MKLSVLSVNASRQSFHSRRQLGPVTILLLQEFLNVINNAGMELWANVFESSAAAFAAFDSFCYHP